MNARTRTKRHAGQLGFGWDRPEPDPAPVIPTPPGIEPPLVALGDCLDHLAAMGPGSVALAFLDAPTRTGSTGARLDWIRLRCWAFRRVLLATGAFCLRCDDPADPHLAAMLGEVFGRGGPRWELDHARPTPAHLEEFVAATTRPGDLVVDGSCRSGTALVAAIRLGRRALGFDGSPGAVTFANRRIAAGVAARP